MEIVEIHELSPLEQLTDNTLLLVHPGAKGELAAKITAKEFAESAYIDGKIEAKINEKLKGIPKVVGSALVRDSGSYIYKNGIIANITRSWTGKYLITLQTNVYISPLTHFCIVFAERCYGSSLEDNDKTFFRFKNSIDKGQMMPVNSFTVKISDDDSGNDSIFQVLIMEIPKV